MSLLVDQPPVLVFSRTLHSSFEQIGKKVLIHRPRPNHSTVSISFLLSHMEVDELKEGRRGEGRRSVLIVIADASVDKVRVHIRHQT